MRVISRKALQKCYEKHPDSKQQLLAWHKTALKAKWSCFNDIQKDVKNSRSIPNNRIIVNIKHNSYRLVAEVNYHQRALYIRFVGTHAEYDRIDAKTI